jgi:hypothetical protein
MAGKFLFNSFIFVLYLIHHYLSLHAGVSTVERRFHPSAIPSSAFADAVEDYKKDSGTDDEGEWRTA